MIRSLGLGNIFAPVCHSVHRGEHPGRYTPQAGTPPGRYTPPGRNTSGRYTPRAGTPPWAGTPPQVHPQAGTPPGTDTPPGRYTPEQCMLGYGQQAGSTHPTGIHSCFSLISYFKGQKFEILNPDNEDLHFFTLQIFNLSHRELETKNSICGNVVSIKFESDLPMINSV